YATIGSRQKNILRLILTKFFTFKITFRHRNGSTGVICIKVIIPHNHVVLVKERIILDSKRAHGHRQYYSKCRNNKFKKLSFHIVMVLELTRVSSSYFLKSQRIWTKHYINKPNQNAMLFSVHPKSLLEKKF